ncbi:synaptonemal complex central element protein 3 isoform X2 [Takifugu rubripes]|uniref:synaptonemal complex central element protein 3 isoform X2 n=1 Tax=Takifugu rubripes TaxID=31033 RepID=UPI0005D15E4D|nr:synaptonemal complex central element protein 3 isoform X2 [Takifugu rubripes]XP_056899587.1 synaptonemal complex central element protein 3 isoform X2 [Takifugu flavidus]|eukprot:XP_011609102.1 PREDICTED: synaptonemal complex central element protein 3 isoform X1 [Takifugu rubripes]
MSCAAQKSNMAGSSFTELHQNVSADMSELTKDLERMVEYTEKMSQTRSEEANVIACADLEKTLQKLENLSDDMAQLALRTQLRLCDLIVCVGHPDKLACPEAQERSIPTVDLGTEILTTEKEDSEDLERQPQSE